MPLSPLVRARYSTQDDGPYGGEQIQAAVLDLEPYTVPRFETSAARDTAYALFVQNGGALEEGMVCHTKDDGARWVYEAGRGWVAYDTRWQTWTPLVSTGPVTNYWNAGNAAVSGRYFRTGHRVDVVVFFQLGSTTTYAAANFGLVSVTYPPGLAPLVQYHSTPAAFTNLPIVGTCGINNNGAFNLGFVGIEARNNIAPSARRFLFLRADGVAATATGAGFNVDSAGDSVTFSASYETAFEA